MAITGNLVLRGVLTGLPSGSRKEVSVSWTIAAGVADVQTVSLALGDNTITIPAGTTLMIVTPPAANTETITVKGAGGDIGHRIAKTVPTPLTVDGQLSTILNASGAVAGVEIFFV